LTSARMHSALASPMQYKFIVDGQWRHDPNLSSMYDDMGNINNVLEVQVGEVGRAGCGWVWTEGQPASGVPPGMGRVARGVGGCYAVGSSRGSRTGEHGCTAERHWQGAPPMPPPAHAPAPPSPAASPPCWAGVCAREPGEPGGV
jgi:hypothetical protein